MQDIIIIAAMAENRIIGKNNVIPWSIKEDMVHFSKLTKGYPCIMGRKTWESLPKKPLPGRLNIIVSGSAKEIKALSPDLYFSSKAKNSELCPQIKPPDQNIKLCPSLPSAIDYCQNHKKIFICGGETIYRQALGLANKIELTVIHRNYEGDTFFPEIDENNWIISNEEKSSSVPNSDGNFDELTFLTYTRIKNFGDRA